MKENINEKGIKRKNIMVEMESGGILEIKWVFLDKSRKIKVNKEMREEGVIK
jgi:hypothetical protein